jgi:sec-independent protein translocase protein TatA
MVPPVPLFPALPGGPELLVVLLVLVVQLLLFLVPVVLVALGVSVLLDRRRGYDERIAELERTVERLEERREE